MKINFVLIIFLVLGFNNYSFSNEVDCNTFKKFSLNYMKCKAGSVKNKTISAGKNFVEDTKNYQKKEWTEEKKKINNVKKKILD
tara:strand:- start:498 stop:749 length:252 start_codon:yes stop_codon:yes gene_type:complete